jgi:hypothetical protein
MEFPVSPENEAAAIEFVKHKCQDLLSDLTGSDTEVEQPTDLSAV